MSAIFLKLTTGGGKTWIKGASTVKGHESWFVVQSFNWSVTAPIDFATGQASGKRQHHPIELVLDAAGSGPAIAGLVVTNLPADAQIDVVAARAAAGKLGGAPKVLSTIKLISAHVQTLTFQADGVSALPAHRIQLFYKGISWSATDAQISTLSDTWVGQQV